LAYFAVQGTNLECLPKTEMGDKTKNIIERRGYNSDTWDREKAGYKLNGK
jgi:hypothetical protein